MPKRSFIKEIKYNYTLISKYININNYLNKNYSFQIIRF